jgi:hypothetical protein
LRIEREVFGSRGDELLVFSDEDGLQPLFAVQQRTPPGAAVKLHEIFDAHSAVRLGVIRSEPVRSFFAVRERWDLLDGSGVPIGTIEERGQRFLRRFSRAGATFEISFGGELAALIEEERGFPHRAVGIRILPAQNPIDPRFIVACALPAMIRLPGAW